MQRNHHIDAAKFVLVLFVVLGHTVESSRDVPGFELLYRWLYLFHMPAFVFLSGMVSSEIIDGQRARALLYSVLLPFLLHQFLLAGVNAYFSGKWRLSPSMPGWALWYLMSLLCWRILLPVVVALRYPVLIAVLVSLIAGLDSHIGREWSLSRTLALLPFFVAGYMWRKGGAGLTLPAFDWRLALIGMVQILGVAYVAQRINIRWLYWFSSYSSLGADALTGIVYRGSLIVIGALGLICILSLVSRCQWKLQWVGELGAASMAPYLLHVYALTVVKNLWGSAWLQSLPVATAWVVALLGSVALTMGCSLIGHRLPWIFNFSWLDHEFRRRATQPGSQRSP